jgi:hypothetical protein
VARAVPSDAQDVLGVAEPQAGAANPSPALRIHLRFSIFSFGLFPRLSTATGTIPLINRKVPATRSALKITEERVNLFIAWIVFLPL